MQAQCILKRWEQSYIRRYPIRGARACFLDFYWLRQNVMARLIPSPTQSHTVDYCYITTIIIIIVLIIIVGPGYVGDMSVFSEVRLVL